MAVSLNSVVGFSSTLRAKCLNVSNFSVRASVLNVCPVKYSIGEQGLRRRLITNKKKWDFRLSAAEGDNLTPETTNGDSSDDQMPGGSFSSPPSNGSPVSIDQEETSPPTASTSQQQKPKRSPLTARERLRAARVLSRYNMDSSSSSSSTTTTTITSKPLRKPELGSKVLDALRESDRGKKKGLPEAPGNMLDDSKRGMPPKGLTFQLPGGTDLFIIIFSFVFISTVMLATTFIVWKLGAIHFNEY